MTRTDVREPSAASSSAPGPPPRQVRGSVWLLGIALLSGVVEALARVAPTSLADVTGASGQLLPRLALYTLVAAVMGFFWRGHKWARLVLAIGIGVVGTASLVIEPVAWLLSGPDLGAALEAMSRPEVVAAVSRAVHLITAVASVTLMLHPATRAYVGRGA